MPINLSQNTVLSSGLTINGVYKSKVNREGLYLYLDAGDLNSYPGSGTVWYDLSEYGNDATIYGSPTWGIVSGATAFTHTVANQFSTGTTGTESPTIQCTVEVWVALSGSEIASGLTDRGEMCLQRGGDSIYNSYIRTTYKLNNYWVNHIPNGYHQSGGPISKQRWHQLMGIWDNKNMYQWLDGVLTSVDNVIGTSTANTDYWIAGSSGFNRWFAGSMAIVRLYNRALHPYEIAENFQANRGRFGI